jgi:hypothetical protein
MQELKIHSVQAQASWHTVTAGENTIHVLVYSIHGKPGRRGLGWLNNSREVTVHRRDESDIMAKGDEDMARLVAEEALEDLKRNRA